MELKAKPLVISEIELLSCDLPTIEIRVVCSKGTYIRALARDIGEALKSGGHLTGLRRTRVGKISIDDCMNVDDAVELLNTVELTFPDDYQPA